MGTRQGGGGGSQIAAVISGATLAGTAGPEPTACGRHRGKVPFKTQAEARWTLKRMQSGGGVGLKVYRCCEVCGAFLIGSRLARVRIKRARRRR